MRALWERQRLADLAFECRRVVTAGGERRISVPGEVQILREKAELGNKSRVKKTPYSMDHSIGRVQPDPSCGDAF